jgi:hypothetical protein
VALPCCLRRKLEDDREEAIVDARDVAVEDSLDLFPCSPSPGEAYLCRGRKLSCGKRFLPPFSSSGAGACDPKVPISSYDFILKVRVNPW